jgi:uncharacterized protein YehS (DUF1456 family)
MTNNDYLRSLRYVLDVSDFKIADIIKLAGMSVSVDEVRACMKHEEDEGYVQCSDIIMAHFLDGLIYFKRGKDESKPPAPFELPISNNLVLKKIKVAFAMKEEDLHEVMAIAGFKVGRAEFSALLRKKGHENYRECGDQFLRNFFKGLALKLRG